MFGKRTLSVDVLLRRVVVAETGVPRSGLQVGRAKPAKQNSMITICSQRMAFCSSVRRWLVPSRLLTLTPKQATSLLGQTPNKRVCHATKTACAATSLSSLADGSNVKQVKRCLQ